MSLMIASLVAGRAKVGVGPVGPLAAGRGLGVTWPEPIAGLGVDCPEVKMGSSG